MSFKKVIFPFIKFKTKPMQDFLDECLKTTIYRVNKDAFSKEVKIGNVTYTVATGGLHSQDNPVELWSSGRELFPSSTGVNMMYLAMMTMFIFMLILIVCILVLLLLIK